MVPHTWVKLLANISDDEIYKRLWFAVRINGANPTIAAVAGLRKVDGETLYLGPSVVLPEFRGRGFQSRLIRARLDQAQALNLPVATAVHMRNTPSLKNVLNAGFRVERFDPEHEDLHLIWEPK